MGSVSEQFRGFTGLEDPDPELGLENAQGVEGGEPVDTGDTLGLDEVEDSHVDGGESDKDTAPVAEGGTTSAESTSVRTETGDRIEDAKADNNPRGEGETPDTGDQGTFSDVRQGAEEEQLDAEIEAEERDSESGLGEDDAGGTPEGE